MAGQALPAGDWEKSRPGDEEHDDDDESYSDDDDHLNLECGVAGVSHIPNEDASKSLLASNNIKSRTPRRRRECTTTTTTITTTTIRPRILIVTVLLSALLGALATLAITALLAHKPAHDHHRNANTLASPSHDPASTTTTKTTFLETAPCGSTPAEARAAGCLFDLVSFNWLPPACHDAPLAAAFEADLAAAGMLSWYEDPARARPLRRDEVATGERTGVYVSLGYHLRHCTAMWRRMHRALMEGGGGLGRVDSYIWSYHHTRHCEEMLLTRYNESDLGEVFTTEVRIKYPDCGVVLQDVPS